MLPCLFPKGLVAELTSPHVQSAWGFWGKRVQAVGLAACCNYLSKKCYLVYFVSVSVVTDVIYAVLNKLAQKIIL